LEQWISRRSDYQAQDDEAAGVRPSQLRFLRRRILLAA
jgi:hypothetical protein